jgi:hypothetical protein
MANYKHTLKEGVLKPKDVDPALLKRLEAKYGPVDIQRDFFSDDLKTYFKTDTVDKETGKIGHKVIKLASFSDALQKMSQAVKSLKSLTGTDEGRNDEIVKTTADELKKVFNKYRTHLRKNYPDQYNMIKSTLEEINTTGGGAGAASFTPGTGAQYATPYAFSGKKKGKYSDGGMYTKKFGYKLVPNKIKGSGLEVKNLFEAETADTFHKRRIAAFDEIEQQLNDVYKLLSNAKNETVQYYTDNPSSYAVVTPTDLVMDYIKDIKDLLGKEE